MQTDSSPLSSVFTFLIGKARSQAAPGDYHRQTMARHVSRFEGEISPDHDRIRAMAVPVDGVPIACAAEHPQVAADLGRRHEARRRCFLSEIRRSTPLLDGEQVESDFFTYLIKDYHGVPARSVVLHRRTNHADLYYLLHHVRVDDTGRLVAVAPPAAPAHAAVARAVPGPRVAQAAIAPAAAAPAGNLTAKGLATVAAKTVASGFLSSVGGMIAGALVGPIMDKIFPPGVPDYFDQVYAEIKKIVAEDLQQSAIDGINGAIRNVGNDLKNEYLPARAKADLNDPADRARLYGLLQKYESSYLSGPSGMLGTLMDDKYAKVGFGAFLLGAGLHLALFQDMANVDPGNRDGHGGFNGPLDSSYGLPNVGTVALVAQQYAAIARGTWKNVLADRRAMITQSSQMACAVGDPTGTSCVRYAWYADTLKPGSQTLTELPGVQAIELVEAPQVKGGKSAGQTYIDQQFQSYADGQVADLAASLSDPDSIISDWEALIQRPIRVS